MAGRQWKAFYLLSATSQSGLTTYSADTRDDPPPSLCSSSPCQTRGRAKPLPRTTQSSRAIRAGETPGRAPLADYRARDYRSPVMNTSITRPAGISA